MYELVCVYCVGVEGMTALNQSFSFVSVLSLCVLWYRLFDLKALEREI